MSADTDSEHQITQWSEALKEELQIITNTKVAIHDKLTNFLKDTVSPGNWTWIKKHAELITELSVESRTIEDILSVNNERSTVISAFYDKAHKESTLVCDNYEKMEECIEVIRTELKDILKKLYSLNTLEMDYYEKLLSVYEPVPAKDPSDRYTVDYEEYRDALGTIHRRDQYQIFRLNIDNMMISVSNIIHKFISVLDNKDNMNEIRKLWMAHQDYGY